MSTIMRKMNIISRCESMYRTKQSADELQGIYHSYILAVSSTPGMSQDKLAKHLCINKSSVTRHLAWLENNGYIERRTSTEDKREMLVFPTAKMQAALPEVVEITKKWNSLISEGISDTELAVFHDVLDRMLDKSIKITYSGDGVQ